MSDRLRVFLADDHELVLEGLRGLLSQNGRVAANSARRTGGNVFDLSRVVYSSCDPCRDDPLAPPLWQLRARSATLDQTARRRIPPPRRGSAPR